MRVDQTYDLIVIGDQLSGFFLAAGAAQRGMRVLVLEESNFPTVLYEVPSGRLLGDFMAEPIVGLEEGSPVDSFLQSLGIYQNLEHLFPRHEPPMQLVSQGFRLDFDYNEKFGAKLGREVQLPPDKIERLRKLLSGEMVSKKLFSECVAEIGLPVTYEMLGPIQAGLYGSLLRDHQPYSEYHELMTSCSRGVRYAIGGRAAIKERLLARIQILGGSLRRNSHVEELVFERNRLAGVLLSSYEGFVRSKCVVGAMGVDTFAHLIPPSMRPRKLEEAVARVKPKAWKLGFTILVPEAVIPEGMGSHVVLFDPDRSFEGDGFLQLQMFPKDVYGGIPAKHRALLGKVLVPYDEDSLKPRNLSNLLKRVQARLETLVPFLREQPFSFFPDPDNLEKDPVFQRYYRFPDLSFIPGSLLVYDRAFAPPEDPSSYLDWSSFGLPGLALCSREIRPLHGLLGEVMSAMELIHLWKGEANKRGFSSPKARSP